MKILRYIYILAIFVLFSGFGHPMYVSITDVEYNKETKGLEIAIKLFIDDLEEALKAEGTGNLYLGTEKESPNADEYLSRYLMKNFDIKVNGTAMALSVLGKEPDKDVMWVYVEGLNTPHPQQITVKNKLLGTKFEGQRNIVHIQVDGKVKSLLLQEGKWEDTAKW